MSKILVMPHHLKNIDALIKIGVDGFILGIKDFSLFQELNLDIDKLKDIIKKIKKSNKEIFLSLNKIVYSKDIPKLKEYLLILEDLNVNGVLYEDLSILKLKEDLKLKTDLVWNQFHLSTNYYTCNYWNKKHNVKYGYLSSEITLDEIIEIKKNTRMSLMVNVFGYLPMFESARSLLTNYLTFIDKQNESEHYKINEPIRNNSYPIYEDSNGTYILSSHILNALSEVPILVENKIDYLVLNSIFIDEKAFVKVCESFVKANKNYNDHELINQLEKVIDINNTDKGFLYKETVYRVKSNG